MKNSVDPALLRFQLKTLLTDKVALLQLAFFHWWLGNFVFGRKGMAVAAAADAALWTNYGLLVALCVALLMGSVCVGFTLIKPRAYGMVELLLASPLSLRKLAGTSFAACLLFSLGNLAAHFIFLKLRYGAVPFGAGFFLSLTASAALTALLLLGAVVASLRRKDADQLHVVLIFLGVLIFAVLTFTRLTLPIPGWLPPALAAALPPAFLLLWAKFDRFLDKERAVRL